MNIDLTHTFESCLRKQILIKKTFESCIVPEEIYQKIIELGKNLPPYPFLDKTPEYLVKGCQSTMYLRSYLKETKMHFEVYSEALISAGLAALLLSVYQGEIPEVILKCPPLFLEEIGLYTALSPSRSSGLSNLFLHMKQESLKALTKNVN
ncbi:Sulfur acceptor protein CsdE [Candidatus Rhabdochlamydia oedothoracis]|uniref:Sulfur acceptor protein CsdE n=1 Tax=Candidatus Rhabdochlamydia oedothoracis TaxID=2720720 RepID=A0ABX8V079_9BACT|nr:MULTISPECIES: SufE family protein [Rhabdochlamydia]KAG6559716.1 Sulfur acceptor protein CsdE [Candidatus Rhabdochlamydia sp. W815]MCL6755733.1 SufE family protein [Candidatus Rhabdochlamydia oedothoracis]QYF48615.1 Sulfur acceptor protein CsdE [Candidatus Rhabdochlamydia oedothoracis]